MNKMHTFAICAYKESPFLEECIQSVKKQEEDSEIYLVTSTPCAFLEEMCERYQIPYYVNEGEGGITQDWNFAYAKCKTPIVTITHQDDIYFEGYAKSVISAVKQAEKPLIYFCDYAELRNGSMVTKNMLLQIKRWMLLPLRSRILQSTKWVRRRILSLGSPICCPSVAYVRENLPEIVFQNHFRTNEDWEAWEMIARRDGQFVYCSDIKMAHRIHEGSETSVAIQESGRYEEDFEMYCKFWPKCIARCLCRVYGLSEKSNTVS